VKPLLLLRQLVAVLLALAVVALNVYWDYTAAPLGLLCSPIVAVLACSLILIGASPWNTYFKAGWCAGLLMLQDAGLKLYGGGAHDAEGQGLLNFLLLLGALLSLGLLQQESKQAQHPGPVPRVGPVTLFLLLLLGHLLLFGNLGLWHYIGTYVE
jgi:hypothetical protein